MSEKLVDYTMEISIRARDFLKKLYGEEALPLRLGSVKIEKLDANVDVLTSMLRVGFVARCTLKEAEELQAKMDKFNEELEKELEKEEKDG